VPDDVPIATDAERVPDPLGVNVTISVQEPPAASAVPALQPRSEKSPGFAPPMASDAIEPVPLPLFVSVTDFDVDLPTATVPKAIAVALGVMAAGAGVGATAAAACDTSSVRPPTEMFAERAAPVFAATL
jgi:hypothetical protein